MSTGSSRFQGFPAKWQAHSPVEVGDWMPAAIKTVQPSPLFFILKSSSFDFSWSFVYKSLWTNSRGWSVALLCPYVSILAIIHKRLKFSQCVWLREGPIFNYSFHLISKPAGAPDKTSVIRCELMTIFLPSILCFTAAMGVSLSSTTKSHSQWVRESSPLVLKPYQFQLWFFSDLINIVIEYLWTMIISEIRDF